MKKGSTLFLKLVLILIGLIVLAWMLFFPQVEGRNQNSDPISLYFNDPFLAYVYIASIPFFIGLYQAFKLLGHIEHNKAFSEVSVKALRNIKYCAIALVCFIVPVMPWIVMFAQDDDSPGVVLIALVVTFTIAVVATAAGVFQKLLQNAVDIKSENDLTV